jgi:asparagine synthase (glutamine-hydrolysing)
MNYPSVTWALEALEVKSAYRGFEVAHPFMDRGLVEFVARIPLDLRIPDGQWKFLLYAGLGDLLPNEVRNRQRKTRFSSFNQALLKQRGSEWAELVFDGSPWESTGYVDPKQIQRTLANSGAEDDSNGQAADRMWRVVNNELWLRQLKQNGSTA